MAYRMLPSDNFQDIVGTWVRKLSITLTLSKGRVLVERPARRQKDSSSRGRQFQRILQREKLEVTHASYYNKSVGVDDISRPSRLI